ncbi:MAG: hypothetical protein IH597_16830 [Bacteroidales bacterium]|nr:hypothetical protein [Bacteroidales bacterium]
MKQTITLHSSFSTFFSTGKPLAQAIPTNREVHSASPWVLSNLMAYSSALFVARTKHFGNTSFLLN